MNNSYDFYIDLDSIRGRQQSRWEDFPLELEKALIRGILDFNERLKAKLIENMMAYDIFDTELASTINIDANESGISIRMDSSYAMFVEYGTGFNGSQSPHPRANAHGWIYMSGKQSGRGEDGWFYPTVEGDPNPYKHMYNGQLYGWTKGLPSRPFMYETWRWGASAINPIINGHINRAMKELGAR